jgi:hypothetical protein
VLASGVLWSAARFSGAVLATSTVLTGGVLRSAFQFARTLWPGGALRPATCFSGAMLSSAARARLPKERLGVVGVPDEWPKLQALLPLLLCVYRKKRMFTLLLFSGALALFALLLIHTTQPGFQFLHTSVMRL